MIVAAHQTMMGPQGAPLPYDAEVEYLECANTSSIIDTGISCSPNLSFEIDASFVYAPSANHWAFGARASRYSQNCAMLSYTANTYAKTRWAYGDSGADVESQTVFCDGSRHAYSNTADKQVLVCSGIGSIASTSTSQFSSGIHFGLFSAYSPNRDSSYSGDRIYGAKFYESGVLAFDGIPVRVGSGSSAVGYLYDRVSGTLFGNAGTGAFTIGPDK